MNKHRHKKTRRCAHCGQPFIVNPRVGKRHRFCTKPACAEVSHYVANKRWLRRNGGKAFHRGDEAIKRVHNWRETHPRYWKRTHQKKRGRHTAFKITKALAAALRYVALQDTIDTRLALEIGIISRLSGSALQDTIAKEIGRLTIRGYAILRGQSIRRSK